MTTHIWRLIPPLHVSDRPLPPHDLELYDNSGRVIARWDGALLDELGTREQMRSNFEQVAALFTAPSAVGDEAVLGKVNLIAPVAPVPPPTYVVLGSLYAHECRFACDSDHAVNCNCMGKCDKHQEEAK